MFGFIRTMSGGAPVHAPLRGAEPLMVSLFVPRFFGAFDASG
jgi:hypothetical protein